MSSETVPAGTPKKDNFVVKLWKKMDIQPLQVLIASKGAIPPVIALAAYESNSWAERYTTLGYLVAVSSMLALPIQPRGKYVRSLLANMIAVLTGTAVGTLAVTCVVAARRNTGGKDTTEYNSSAAVTSAVWLFFSIWLANTVRAKNPALMIPSILYTIFSVIFATASISFPNMTVATAFVRRLVEVFFTGFALATGVSLFIVPFSSRMIVKKQLAGVFGLVKATLMTHGQYMQAVATSHQLKKERTEAGLPTDDIDKIKNQENLTPAQASAKALKGKISTLALLCTKTKVELSFAKKEIGYGKLDAGDYTTIQGLISKTLMPLLGLGTFIDIVEAITKHKQDSADYADSPADVRSFRQLEAEEWEEAISLNSEAYGTMKTTMIAGITHVTQVLELTPKPKKAKSDPEKAAGAEPTPGDPEFAKFFSAQLDQFHSHRETAIQKWCQDKGIELPTSFWDDPAVHYKWEDLKKMESNIRHKQNEQQLYLFLYSEYLAHMLGQSILKAVEYADSKLADGSMKKNRIINPGFHRIKRLMMSLVRKEDSEEIPYEGQTGRTFIEMGDFFNKPRDPEHLPPVTTYEKATNYLRAVPHLLASDASAFGFRAAVATISIGIIAYIEQTHLFFTQQRGVWALIMTGISMSPNAGQGIFGFTLRVAGTVVAMACCYANWYMCDQKVAAVLPVMFLIMTVFWLVLLKKPEIAIVCIITAITMVLVIGYEIQANKVGITLVETNGQDYYPLYELAPFRVLNVVIGLTVAFIWTYFPYPITTHSTLRKDLGGSLYLLGNYYSCAHTTIAMRIKEGAKLRDLPKGSPADKLDKARLRVFGKFLLKLTQLHEHSKFTKWEPKIGGRFPTEQYDELIESIRNVFNYISLMVYSSESFTLDANGDQEEWVQDFRRFAESASITSQEIASLLCLTSACINNSQPLPPFLRAPQPYQLASKIQAIDPNILSVKHINEPFYASFAVLEIASSLCSQEMEKIIKMVKGLVGEADFSYRVTTEESELSSRSTLINRSDSNTTALGQDEERRARKEREE